MKTITSLIMSEYKPTKTTPIKPEIALRLKEIVTHIAKERNMYQNTIQLEETKNYIKSEFEKNCDITTLQGKHENIIAYWGTPTKPIIIGGHFDGPPNSPGADDNGSAIACLISLAEQLKKHKPKNIILIAFNGEEHGFLGSKDFVASSNFDIKEAIILEMVGYYTNSPNSQTMPNGFPEISIGDFLAIVGNNGSKKIGKKILKQANKSGIQLPLREIKIPAGLEKIESISHVRRSDHAPFWDQKIPAVMLTDTAEFRNQNYHKPTDTPDTLNYEMMSEIVKLLKNYCINNGN